MISFVEATKASRSDLLYLVTAKDKPSGKDAWWYVLVRNKQIVPIFLNKVKTTGGTLSDYGEVLRSGWGKEPPEATALEIEEELKTRKKILPEAQDTENE